MRKTVFGILAGGLSLVLGTAAQAQTQNFDSIPVGTLPAGWSGTSTGAGAAWTVTNSDSHSPSNSAFTNDVASLSQQYLLLPSINAAGSVIVDFWYHHQCENATNFYDGWVVEASINGGAFTNIGQSAWTTGGYNVTISTCCNNAIAGQRAFGGTVATWTHANAVISANAGDVVQLRFNMSSDTSIASTGVWLDDISVTTASNFGACCDATGACGQNSPTGCTSSGGFFFGTGNACSATTCPVGACCNNGNCAMKISNACSAGGGSFFSGGSCTADFITPAIGTTALEDISSTSSTPGTAFALTGGSLDDGYQMNIPLGFTFNFYGVPQTTINIATNGVVYFGGTTYSGLPAPNTGLPSANTPVNVIAPYWSDMVLQSTDQITYAMAGVAPYRRFIVQWNNIPRYNAVAGGTGSVTAEVILYEGADAVSFRYGTLNDGAPTNTATAVGVANSATQATNVDPNSVRPGNTSVFLQVGANPCSGALPTGSCCSNGCQQFTYSACLAAGGAFNGNGTTCVSAPCNSGACCGLTGGCTLQVGPICTGASGVYQGNGTACGATPCPASGRCCSGTVCGIAFQANCSGVFTAGISSCTPNTCAGSCCDSSGLCTLVSSAGACAGTFGSLGTTCSPSPCPGQTCAIPIPVTLNNSVAGDLAASVTTSTITCSSGTHGLWYSFTAASDATYAFNSTLTSGAGNPSIGIFGPCGTQLACQNPCGGTSTTATLAMTAGQQVVFRAGGCGDVELAYSVTVSVAVVGACCNDTSGACTTTNSGASGCAAGTTYMGQDSVCSAVLCGQGACCNDTTAACTLSAAAGCGGTFQTAGSTCATVACPTVACCDPANGTCSVVGPTGVCPGSSTPQGAGTSCNPNVCPQPPTGACCNTANGACTQVFAINCDANTSTYGGNNTTCDASGFCPGIGTCCSTLGNCVVLYSGSCPGGLTSNASLTCTANLCPATGPHTCENFDAGSPGTLPNNWTTTATGAGAPWTIDAAQSNSAPNAVFTNDVNTNSVQILQMPDVTSGASGLTLDFLSYFDTEGVAPNFFDGWVVEYSTDAGGTWTDIAVGGSWVLNGYNAPAISVNFASAIGGRPAFSGLFTSWIEHIGTIPTTAGQTVSIRFMMVSDSSIAHVGVWLDNICVGGIQSSAGGVCCRGMTCSTAYADAAACAAATPAHPGSADPFYKFFPAATVCNTPPVPPNTIGNARTPCCFANYNKNSAIEIQDIFDFLNDWFAGRAIAVPSGDGTSNAGLAVQNIFDFLNSWFGGGCS